MDTESEDTFNKNLTVVEKIYPGIADLLKSVSPTDSTLSGIDKSEFDAEKELKDRWSPESEIHIVDRFGEGRLARILFEWISIAELNDDRNRRMILCEDRPEILRALLEREDWSGIVQSERCLLAVGESGQDAFRRLLHRYPEIGFASFQLYAGDDTCTEERRNSLIRVLSDNKKKVHAFIQGLIDENRKHPKPPFPATIRFFAAGHNFLQDACVHSLKMLGYDAGRLQWKTPLYRFVRSTAWLNEFRTKQLDTAIFLNTTPRLFTHNTVLEKLPIRTLSWFVDNPRRFSFLPQQYEGCDVIAVFDRTYIPFLRDMTNAKVLEVRTGYCIDPAKAVRRDDYSNIDIAFVGELGTRGFLTHELLALQNSPETIHLANQLLKDIDVTQPCKIEDTVENAFAERNMNYQGPWVEYLENKATSLRRRYFLEALTDKNLVIFGDEEWSDPDYAGKLVRCYTGKRVDYHTEIPSLYASAKININIFHVQCVGGLNPRVYDVLACGGFLLTTYNPALEDEFEIGKDLQVFHNKNELADRIDYYLAHPQERREIAERGRARALANCGCHDRMQILLAALVDRSPGDSYAYLCR